MFENFKDTLEKMASATPTTIYVRPIQYNKNDEPAQEASVIFCSDGGPVGQATILLNGKPMPGVKRFDYCFGRDGRMGKGYLALEQYVSWFIDTAPLIATLEKQGIEVVFVPSTSLRKNEIKS